MKKLFGFAATFAATFVFVLIALLLTGADVTRVDNDGVYTPAYASRANTFEANQTIGVYTFATGGETSPDVDAGGVCLNQGTADNFITSVEKVGSIITKGTTIINVTNKANILKQMCHLIWST